MRLVDPTYEGRSSKITRVVELCTELAEEGNRALVFSQFTQFLGKIRLELEAAGLRVAYLAGETPTAKRQAIVEAFQRAEYDVFCVSLLAGGTGLNLTSASYLIHTDPWWNPAAEEQATSRAARSRRPCSRCTRRRRSDHVDRAAGAAPLRCVSAPPRDVQVAASGVGVVSSALPS